MGMTYTYYFVEAALPTPYNLSKQLQLRGYCVDPPGQLNDSHIQLDEPACRCLEYKHLLSQLTQQHCPEVMPKTWHLHDYNVEEVCQAISDLQVPTEDKVWILKPSMLNNGQGIQLFSSVQALQANYASPHRYGGDHVLQQYIVHPHCLQGHKYTVRLFVVITNNRGIFLYRQGYFNVARTPYQPGQWHQLDCHLTMSTWLDMTAGNSGKYLPADILSLIRCITV